MSTNKRKDAAALFELIEKSTLKVPKNAGQLKIPTWWSSRDNPASAKASATVETEELPPNPAAPKKEQLPVTTNGVPKTPDLTTKINAETAPAPANGSSLADATVDSSAPKDTAQQKLFDPHAQAEAAPSPSFRPPVKAAAPVITAPTAAPAPATAHPTPTKSAAPDPTPPHRNPAGVFAPKTMDSSTIARRNWSGQQRMNFARVPRWAMFGTIAAVGALVVIVVFIAMSSREKATPGHGSTQGPQLIPGPPIHTPGIDHTGDPGQTNTNVITPAPPQHIDTPEQAKVWGAGEITRTADLVYLIVATSPTEDIAKRNADFIVSKGVSVSIEKTKKGFFSIISVQGFAKQNEASEDFRKKLVAIGREHPDAKRLHKGAWDDAYFAKVTATTTPANK